MHQRTKAELSNEKSNSFFQSFKYFALTFTTGLFRTASGYSSSISLASTAAIMARYVFLPFAAFFSVLNAIYAWRQAKLERYQALSVGRALIETLSAAATIGAIVTSFVLAASLGFVAPALLAGAIGIRALYKAGEAVYFHYKWKHTANWEEKNDYRQRARIAGFEAGIGLALAASFAVLQVFAGGAAQLIGAASMIVACVVGGLVMHQYAKRLDNQIPSAPDAPPPQPEDHDISSTNRMARALGRESLYQDAPSAPSAEELNVAAAVPQQPQLYPELNQMTYPPEVNYKRI